MLKFGTRFPEFSRCISVHISPTFVLKRKDFPLSGYHGNQVVELRRFGLRGFVGFLSVPSLVLYYAVTSVVNNTSVCVLLSMHVYEHVSTYVCIYV